MPSKRRSTTDRSTKRRNRQRRGRREKLDFFGQRMIRNREEWHDAYRHLRASEGGPGKPKYEVPHVFDDGKGRYRKEDGSLILNLEKDILPGGNYARKTNYVVTAHFGFNGRDMSIDQRRMSLFMPNSVRNERFAALIAPQNSGTVLFFTNGKIVLTGKTTPYSALFALQMYKIVMGRVSQPVMLCRNAVRNGVSGSSIEKDTVGTPELCYLKTLLGFSNFSVQNTVGSGPLTMEGETVSLAALRKAYPETSWNPQIFPGLKFLLPVGNNVIPGGHKCTAHLFEKRIVLMGPKFPSHINIAYWYFLKLVKPFVIKLTTEYETDPNSYRYNQMMSMHSIADPFSVRKQQQQQQQQTDRGNKRTIETEKPVPSTSPGGNETRKNDRASDDMRIEEGEPETRTLRCDKGGENEKVKPKSFSESIYDPDADFSLSIQAAFGGKLNPAIASKMSRTLAASAMTLKRYGRK